MTFSRRIAVLLALPLLVFMTGCGTSAPEVKTPPSSYPELSFVPPPEAPYEEPLTSTDPMHEIWRPGYWAYDGASFVWVPGILMPKPDPTATWEPERWDEHSYGWGFVHGRWQ